jgi:hypothetical protein
VATTATALLLTEERNPRRVTPRDAQALRELRDAGRWSDVG